jgi:hypothetical protein
LNRLRLTAHTGRLLLLWLWHKVAVKVEKAVIWEVIWEVVTSVEVTWAWTWEEVRIWVLNSILWLMIWVVLLMLFNK